MEPAADSPPADSDTIGNVSSLGAPQDSSVSDADNQWNRNEVNLTRLERDFFLPRNVLPDRPKSVYFRTNERLEFKDVLESIRGAGINDRDIECIQFKRLSDDARDVHITFSSAAVCALFSRPESLRVKEKSYYIQSSFRRITYVAVFDAPHELPDEPIVQRLQDRFQCTVVNTRRNKHQGTDIPNGIRTYSVVMRKDLPATMRFGRFVIRFHYSGAGRRCNKCSQEGHVARDCPESMCFNCDNLGHESRQCPGPRRCCICKSTDHLVDKCQYAWSGDIAPSRQPAPPIVEGIVTEEVIMDSETTPFDLTASEDNMEPLSLSWADASEPASQPAATVPCSRDGQGVSTSSPPTQSQPSYSHVTQSLPSSIDKSSLSSGSSQRPHKHTSVDPCGQSFVSPPMRARISKLSLRRQSTPEEVSHSKRSKGSAHKPSSSCSK